MTRLLDARPLDPLRGSDVRSSSMSGRPTALENVPQLLVCGPVGLASRIDLMRPACERVVGTCCVAQLVSGIYAP